MRFFVVSLLVLSVVTTRFQGLASGSPILASNGNALNSVREYPNVSAFGCILPHAQAFFEPTVCDILLNLHVAMVQGANRALLATSCEPLQVGSQTYSFDNCEDLSSQTGTPFTLYYTLEASPSGGTLFKGGLKVKSTGYDAIAFGRRMIGSNAVIVYPDSAAASGASVDGYKIGSYLASQINAAKGSFPLQDTAAAKTPDGFLVAAFTASLDGTPESWATKPSNMLYVANGKMNGNQIDTHLTFSSRYGNLQVPLAYSSIPPVVASATPTPTPETVPSPSLPVIEPTPGSQPTAETTPAPATTPASEVSTPITTGGASDTVSSQCVTSVTGKSMDYNACYSVTRMAPDFMVYYNFTADPADPASSVLSMAFSGTSDGYFSVGFPQRPGKMVGSNAMILTTCSACSSGANLQQYYLAGEQESDVQVANNMVVSDAFASSNGGVLHGSFKVKLPGVAATISRRRSLLQTSNFQATSYPLIYAAGPVSSSDAPLMHNDEATGNVDLMLGESGSGGGGNLNDNAGVTDSSSKDTYKTAHAWMMVVSWGVMIPVGILTARYFKAMGSWWFHVHRAFQTLAFIIATIALAFGFVANGGWETDLPVHRNLGIAATALAVVQITALVARPAPEHRHRSYWFHMHAWIGRSAAILSIANIYYGIINVQHLGVWAWASYTGVLGAIVLAAVVMEMQRCTTGRFGEIASAKTSANTTPSVSAHNEKAFMTSTTTSPHQWMEARSVPL